MARVAGVRHIPNQQHTCYGSSDRQWVDQCGESPRTGSHTGSVPCGTIGRHHSKGHSIVARVRSVS